MATNRNITMRTALVTGGSRNIGKLSALAIAAKGVDVIITYNEKADLAAETVKEIERLLGEGVREPD